MPEISIIIPNYNTENYLPRCLNSLIHQTFQNIEIIVIDDGSSDNSVSLIQDFQSRDKRIHLIQQKNAGPAAARNKGLQKARGKYLMFCDSDDWYEPNMCEVMYHTIETKNADVVCCQNYFEFEKDLNPRLKSKRAIAKYFNPKLKEGNYPITPRLRFKIPVLLWQKIFRKDLIDKEHLSFIRGNKQDDTAFWYEFCFITKSIYYLPIPLYHYFIRNQSIAAQTLSDKNKKKESFQVAQQVFLFCKKKNLLASYPQDIINIFLAQLKFAKDSFSQKTGLLYAKKANFYLQELPLYCRILFLKSNFVACYQKPNFLLLKVKKYWLYLKSHIGTQRQKRKRKRKIFEIQSQISFFQEHQHP